MSPFADQACVVFKNIEPFIFVDIPGHRVRLPASSLFLDQQLLQRRHADHRADDRRNIAAFRTFFANEKLIPGMLDAVLAPSRIRELSYAETCRIGRKAKETVCTRVVAIQPRTMMCLVAPIGINK